MKNLIILIFLIFNSCAVSPVKMYERSDNFIDIEINRNNFYMECVEIDKKENKSLMAFYAIDNDIVHQFIFRKISETAWCEKNVKKPYNKLMKNVFKVRLVGTSPLEKEKNSLINKPVPEKLKIPNFC